MFSPSLEMAAARASSTVSPEGSLALFNASASVAPEASAACATASVKATKFSSLATKSVSELISTITALPPFWATAMRPSAAMRLAFLSALARPDLRSHSAAASMSPLFSVSAFLHSIMPAPVRSRSSLTREAVISDMGLPQKCRAGIGQPSRYGGPGPPYEKVQPRSVARLHDIGLTRQRRRYRPERLLLPWPEPSWQERDAGPSLRLRRRLRRTLPHGPKRPAERRPCLRARRRRRRGRTAARRGWRRRCPGSRNRPVPDRS